MGTIGQLSHDWFPQPIPRNVEIGPGSWVYSSFAFLHYRSERPCGVCIGRHSGVYNGTFFDLGIAGEVTVGDYCTLVGAIISANCKISIADYVFIAHEVTIADHFAGTPRGVPINRNNQLITQAGEIFIGEGAWIGARAILLPGARIGAGAIVGAATVVNEEVPPFSTVAGNPARIRLNRNPR